MGEPVLVVDDHVVNLKLARVILEASGYAVRTAGDAEQALHVLEELKPRLILMDLQLPGMDGLELTRLLKARADTADIPIVALTAYAMVGDAERAREAGCDDYITKPLERKLLLQTLARLLQ